jgi:hypothetical protein
LLLCALVAAPTVEAAKKKKPPPAKTKPTRPAKPPPEPEPAPTPPAKKSTVLLDTNPAALAVQLEQTLSEGFTVAAADTALPEDLDRDAVMKAAKKARAVAVVTARYANNVWIVRTWAASDGGVVAEGTFKAPREGPKAVVPRPLLGKLLAGALKAESSAGASGADDTAAGAGTSPKDKPKDKPKPTEPTPVAKPTEPEPKEEPVEPAPAETGEKPKAVHVGVSAHIIDRRFFYEDDLFGALSRYRQPLAPHLGAELEFYPGAFITSGPLSWFGITGSVDFLAFVTAVAADGTRYPTSSLRLRANLAGRIPIADRLELGITFGYALTTYGITGDAATRPNVPDVAYSALRPAASVGLRLVGPLWIKVGGGYHILLNTGQLGSAEYFPRITGGGFDASAGVMVRLFRFVEVRAAYEYQRYWFSMNPEPGDPYIAGGALDDSRGFSVTAAFTY